MNETTERKNSILPWARGRRHRRLVLLSYIGFHRYGVHGGDRVSSTIYKWRRGREAYFYRSIGPEHYLSPPEPSSGPNTHIELGRVCKWMEQQDADQLSMRYDIGEASKRGEDLLPTETEWEKEKYQLGKTLGKRPISIVPLLCISRMYRYTEEKRAQDWVGFQSARVKGKVFRHSC